MKRHKLEVQSADSSSPNTDNFRLIVVSSRLCLLRGSERVRKARDITVTVARSSAGGLGVRARLHGERRVARRLQVWHHELQRLQERLSVCADVR